MNEPNQPADQPPPVPGPPSAGFGGNVPTKSPVTDDLMKRYVEDRSSLTAEELDQLIAALRAQPTLAIELRTQLLVDDLLAQKLAVDRKNFLAQVGQRIGDYEQGEEEIYNQVSELRALAEAELVERPQRSTSQPWSAAIILVLAASIAAVAFLAPQYWPQSPRPMATVRALSGDVVALREGQRVPVQMGDTVSTGTPLEVASDGKLELEYRDKTSVAFGAGTRLQLVADRKSQAKWVQLDQGEALAKVTPQRDVGPMIFSTPHARAIVVGTELRLQVNITETRLDVTEGKVDLERVGGGAPLRVAAHQSGIATQQSLALRELTWPDDADHLLFSVHKSGVPHVRNPESGNPRETLLDERGPARMIRDGQVFALNGGNFVSTEAGEDLVANIRSKGAFTIETVIIPDSIYRVKDARVLALGDDGKQADFQLLQRGDELVFRLWTDGSDKPQELKLGPVKPDRALHVTIAYDGESLTGYRDGVACGTVTGIRSGLSTWNTGALSLGSDADGRNAWRGVICGLAITDRAMQDFEVTQSLGQYQTLYAHRDHSLLWDNLMADDLDPTRFAGAGNWQIVDDSWQNEAADNAWFGLGPDNLKSYDLLVDVNWVEGDGPLKMALPVAKRAVAVVLGKSGGEQKTALQDMGGQPMSGQGAMQCDHLLPQGRTARVEAQVRLHQDSASLTILVDGETWLDWEGSPSELPELASDALPASRKPVLVTAGNVVRIESLKVRDLNRMASGAIGQ
jgi:ferric-dicitrate binding protein FerR (iron transport regulator)